jgi:TPR repeat protein
LYESGRLGWKDLPQAVAWYRRAAEAGSPQAQLEMGTACFLGRGTPQDLAQAAQWYRQAALAGDLGAMYILASMYEKGEGGRQPPAGALLVRRRRRCRRRGGALQGQGADRRGTAQLRGWARGLRAPP